MDCVPAIGCNVVAEGVETDSELAALRRIGVNKAQGYLLGRPMAQQLLRENGLAASESQRG